MCLKRGVIPTVSDIPGEGEGSREKVKLAVRSEE
jgi:hypothetical protein